MFVKGFQEYRWVRVGGSWARDGRRPSARTVDKEEFVMRRKCYSQRGKAVNADRHVRIASTKGKYSLKTHKYT